MGTTAYAARVGSGYAYPTAVHERAAQAITEFLASRGETDAVLLVNSCARGKATVDSSRLATSSFTPRLFSSAASASSAYAQRDDEALRRERLQAARWFVLDTNLARIPGFLDRDLYFQAFDCFYRAFQGPLFARKRKTSARASAQASRSTL